MPKRLARFAAWGLTLLLATVFLSPLRTVRPPDFMPFYFAGKLARSGRIAEVHHKPAYQPLIAELRATGERMNPVDAHYFIRPAFQAFFYVPFTFFSYPVASLLAIAANVALLGVLIWKLPVWFSVSPSVRVWLFAFKPFLWSIGIGQDTLLLTLLVAGSLVLAARDREVLAGALLGLGVFKPHLVWALPLVLVAAGRWKMVASFLAVAVGLGGVSLAAVGRSGFQEWIALVQAPSSDYLPHIMGNVRAVGLQLGAVAGGVAALVVVASFTVILLRGCWADRISAALLAALLLSPHTYWQDYSLAALAALLSVRSWPRYILLLPWPYFYFRNDLLPFVFLSLVWLCVLAAKPLLLPRLRTATT